MNQASQYLLALAKRNILEKYLDFFPLWALQERLAARDTKLFQHQIRLEAGQNLLGVLDGDKLTPEGVEPRSRRKSATSPSKPYWL